MPEICIDLTAFFKFGKCFLGLTQITIYLPVSHALTVASVVLDKSKNIL
jgi:hypothetical protein